MAIILSNLNRSSNYFTRRPLGKFAVKWVLEMSPNLAYVATLPCETLTSENKVIVDKLKGSVATYLRHAGVVNDQIKKAYR